jgi:hypothetical protein
LNASFDPSVDKSVRRFIAIILINLLAQADIYWEDNQPFRIASTDLFDDVLAPDIYPKVGLTPKHQTFEKLGALKSVRTEAIAQLSSATESATSLTVMSNTQQEVLRAIGDPLVKAVLSPLLPNDVASKGPLLELFQAVDTYRKADGPLTRSEFERAKDIIGAFQRKTDLDGGPEELKLFKVLADRVDRLLSADFERHPANAPAALSVGLTEKKYPLHLADEPFDVGLVVTNDGPGQAFDVTVSVVETEGFQLDFDEVYLGEISPGLLATSLRARTCGLVAGNGAALLGDCSWRNFSGEGGNADFCLSLKSQRADIDWGSLEASSLYGLEPVDEASRLVGRGSTVHHLLGLAESKTVGSAYVFGQKRVGKTSIVKTLKTLLDQDAHHHTVVYLEGGDYIRVDAGETVAALGRILCDEVRASNADATEVPLPTFTDALAPLSEYLRTIAKLSPNFRAVFILDEFDELPLDLYRRSTVGDAFFLTLRTISGKAQFGFILVGGEKMELILSAQGENLNKFDAIRVDYFDRSTQWADFSELVRAPVSDWLEITDEAVVGLYDQTAGNPYFTNLICGELAKLMISRRDNHATTAEVAAAVNAALSKVASPSFMHFWEDAIFETGAEAEALSLSRRKCLLAVAKCLREKGSAKAPDIIASGRAYGLDGASLEGQLADFTRRGVLVEEDDAYACRVPFFQRWLIEKGYTDIITSFADREGWEKLRKAEEAAFVRAEELVSVANSWGLYRGREVGSEPIRSWLNQFGSTRRQRLMFRLLEGLQFVTSSQVRSWLKEAHGIAVRALAPDQPIERYGPGRERRGDLLIVRVGGTAKSGAVYSKLYADENAIYTRNVVDLESLSTAIARAEATVRGLIVVDDFLGSGGSLAEAVRDIGGVLRIEGVRLPLVIVALLGFDRGRTTVEESARLTDVDLRLHLCRILTTEDQAFSAESRFFPDATEREEARTIAAEVGARLVTRNPLGWNDTQAAVVFEYNIPNNSLPILWAEGQDWHPLFPRFS